MRQAVVLNRIQPRMAPQAYKTYGWSMPLRTHWRPASCEEVNCAAFYNGWVTTVDLSTDLGKRQYHFITHDRDRRPAMQQASLTLVKFVYGPGFRCFQSGDHRLPLERPARFYVAGGDWRGNPMNIPVQVHRYAEDWADDFANHQDRLATAIQRG